MILFYYISPSLAKNNIDNLNSNSSNNSNGDPNNLKNIDVCINKPMVKFEQIKKKSLDTEKKVEDLKEEIMASSSNFKRMGFIGQGSSGLVEKALYIPKNLIVALKVIFF